MAHEAMTNYSNLVLAKIRQENILKTGVIFNSDYEGDAASGLVKIPVRDEEVEVSDYDKANGIKGKIGSTSYENFVIDHDKAVNEIIDGFDAQTVPDNLVADRIDSAGYSLARAEDTDGASTLLAGAVKVNIDTLDENSIYSRIVDVRTALSKNNIPNDNKRYLLVTPDAYALVIKSPEFIKASDLGDAVVQTGAIGRIAGFNVFEWNDNTPGFKMLAGHPRFATRAEAFKKDIHLQDLDGSGEYIGASAVQGRLVYGHKMLRSKAFMAVFSPAALTLALAKGAANGTTIATVTGGDGTYYYKVDPSVRAVYDMATKAYGGTELTSGTTEIPVSEGDIIEVVNITGGKVTAAGYIEVKKSNIAVAEG